MSRRRNRAARTGTIPVLRSISRLPRIIVNSTNVFRETSRLSVDIDVTILKAPLVRHPSPTMIPAFVPTVGELRRFNLLVIFDRYVLISTRSQNFRCRAGIHKG